MADIFTEGKRSEIMARISGKETKPEVLVRKFLFANGFRFRKNVNSLPGSPDIVLRKFKAVIFVNGCFWHGHKNCKKARLPKTNADFWSNKITKNKGRDIKVRKALRKDGWRIITVWQCDLANVKMRQRKLNSIIRLLIS